MKHVLLMVICALVIISLTLIIFNLKVSNYEKNETFISIPQLDLSNPRSILQPGSCTNDQDCENINLDLHCLGNVCVLKPNLPNLPNKCNEENKCYNTIIGLDSIGSIVNECIPLQSQFFDRDNCNGKNPFNCINGIINNEKCIPNTGFKTLYFYTYGGREKIPITMTTKEANLFKTANSGILFDENELKI